MIGMYQFGVPHANRLAQIMKVRDAEHPEIEWE